MLNRAGHIDNPYKQDILNQFFEKAEKIIDGELYIGYPVYYHEVTNQPINIDAVLLTKKGFFIIIILEAASIDYEKEEDYLYTQLEIKFKKYSFLLDRRELKFKINVLTFCEKTKDAKKAFIDIDSLVNAIRNSEQSIDDELYNNILSGIQDASGLGKRVTVVNSKMPKASLIEGMNNIIERYDETQMKAILSDTSGIQRIRGMAGSGKTIILARKAVELHIRYPDWRIVVTYFTRSVKAQLEFYIEKFYKKINKGNSPNYNNLLVMHSWGGASARGVYYDICEHYNIPAHTYQSAKNIYSNKKAFEGACNELLGSIDKFVKLYDCVLIDEAQDLPIPFFKLCINCLDYNKRLVYAYDELQKLNEEAMPTPEKIFGFSINADTPLKVCYRNQSPVIVTAHSIGMGIYRNTEDQIKGLIQLPPNNIWTTIGYEPSNRIIGGNEVTLRRTKDTSPDFLNANKDSLVEMYGFDTMGNQYTALIKMIKDDIYKDGIPYSQIMIIDMDHLSYNKNFNVLSKKLLEFCISEDIQLQIHLAGTISPEDFAREDSVVYSSVIRAKGNEAYMVYLVNSHMCVNSLTTIRDRNSLFTAITRSKGWVRVLGSEGRMSQLISEFEKVKENNYTIHFIRYPNEQERRNIRTTNKDIDRKDIESINSIRKLMENMSEERKADVLKTVLGGDISDELIKALFDNND